jgi:signal peptidase I
MPTAAQEPSGWLESVQVLFSTIVVAVFIVTFAVQAFQIPSGSMEETLLIGDYLFVDKLHFGSSYEPDLLIPYRPVQRGDIVVFYYPVNPAQHLVKRVIGVPKDRIRLVNKQVWINGVPQREDYVRLEDGAPDVFRDNFPRIDFLSAGINARWFQELRDHVDRGELVVPPGEYFVMGDNRENSYDSRFWGFVPEGNIVGRPLLIYWSLRDPGGDLLSAGDKISHFLYVLTHLFQITRWDRTFRIVR